jgi:hypothetical protein
MAERLMLAALMPSRTRPVMSIVRSFMSPVAEMAAGHRGPPVI